MTPTEYAQRYYGGKPSTVYGLLNEGRICGAYKEGRNWFIPDGAKIVYKPRKKKNRSIEDDLFDILKALYSNRYIDETTICLSEEDFTERVYLLREQNLIADSEIPKNGITSTGLRLTAPGIKLAQKKKNAILRTIKALIPNEIRISFNLINIA